MARLIPSAPHTLSSHPSAIREVETLEFLARELPDDYRVFHGVHWTRLKDRFTIYGEVDFAIVAPSGRLLLIEQKSGALVETDDGLAKQYPNQTKLVRQQMARSADELKSKFGRLHGWQKLNVETLLYCPDHAVSRPDTAAIDAARIVDAKRKDQLPQVVRSILPLEEPPDPIAEEACRFLANELQLVPEIGAVVGETEALYTRLSGGLAEWGRKLEFEPFRLRVIGTAGSGKTQLALAVFKDAVASGKRPLYVCFNRPLADHMTQITPKGGEVATYHQLCDRFLRACGVMPDFRQADAFANMEAAFAAADPGEDWRFDEVIVDEGQDFQPGWVPTLHRLLRPGGRAWWLEDPMQNLYGRPPVDLPGWIVLRADTNYRSPRDVLEHLNRLLTLDRPIEAGSPIGGSDVGMATYADARGLIDETKKAIKEAIATGFRKDMIAVVSFRGIRESALMPFDKLGEHRIRKFTGDYDLIGSPIYTQGDLLVDSVYRFKGRSAPCVILTEIDFEALGEKEMRKVFVGATRATMKLHLVMSERAAGVLLQRLGSAQ
jgi:hypothetical protein